MIPALLLLACTSPSPDSGEPALSTSTAWYGRASQDPVFAHSNATWAGAALLDYDGDGWLDVFLTNGNSHPDALYRNNGDGSFTDVAAQAGVDSRQENGSVVAGDLDNDGDTNLVVAGACSTGTLDSGGFSLQDGHKLVYVNRGDGTFQLASLALEDGPDSGVLGDCTYSLGLVDVDGDGFLDLLVSDGIDPDLAPPWVFQKTNGPADDVVLYNDGAGGFDRAEEHGEGIGTFAAVVADFDGDGRAEIIGGTAGSDLARHRYSDGALVSDPTTTGAGLWMGLAAADFDGDGDLDIYSTNMGLSPLIAGYDNLQDVEHATGVVPFHSVFENRDGVLTTKSWPLSADQTLAGDLFTGLDGRYMEWVPPADLQRQAWGWGAAAIDADADGWPDVAWTGNNCAAPMTIIWDEAHGAGPGALLRNDEGQGFIDVTWTAGIANVDDQDRYADGRGVAVGDLDNDGHADLVMTNKSYNPSQSDPLAQQTGFATFWLSSQGQVERGHWLQVDPVGSSSNRDGVGSEVRLSLPDGRVLLQVVGAGGGTNSSHELLASFGLGEAQRVDVEVRFPSGEVISLQDVAAGQRLTVEEP